MDVGCNSFYIHFKLHRVFRVFGTSSNNSSLNEYVDTRYISRDTRVILFYPGNLTGTRVSEYLAQVVALAKTATAVCSTNVRERLNRERADGFRRTFVSRLDNRNRRKIVIGSVVNGAISLVACFLAVKLVGSSLTTIQVRRQWNEMICKKTGGEWYPPAAINQRTAALMNLPENRGLGNRFLFASAFQRPRTTPPSAPFQRVHARPSLNPRNPRRANESTSKQMNGAREGFGPSLSLSLSLSQLAPPSFDRNDRAAYQRKVCRFQALLPPAPFFRIDKRNETKRNGHYERLREKVARERVLEVTTFH